MKKAINFLVAALSLLSCNYEQERVDFDVHHVPHPKSAESNAFVSNPNAILSSETVQFLNAQLFALENETGAEVAVVVVTTIGLNEIDDFAHTLFNQWGVGKAGKDNGVLILFVLDQKAIRFEIGYGLEGALPDAMCKRIQTQVMLPEFKKENYDAGMLAGVDLVIKIIKEEPIPKLTPVFKIWLFLLCVTGLILIFGPVRFIMMRRNVRNTSTYQRKKLGDAALSAEEYASNADSYYIFKSDRNMSLGCSLVFMIPILLYLLVGTGLLSWQFLTLLLAPLLAVEIPINIWARLKMKKMRQTPLSCDDCKDTMQLLPSAKGKQSLSKSQQFENSINSMNYDVYKCTNCQKELIFPVKYQPYKKYAACSKCGTKSLKKKDRKTIKRATYSNSGVKEVTYLCLFCQHTETRRQTIPRLQYSSGSGSSSSSRSGSFGGGRSGGGGSTSRW